MIISHDYKFVFVANTKAASTSIEAALSQFDSGNYVNLKPQWHSKHASLSTIHTHFPAIDNYFKFGFIRNPFDWVVSWYNFRKKVNNSNNTKNIKFKDWLINLNSTAYNFIGLGLNVKQSDILTSPFINLDFIGQYENIDSDFNQVCNRIGIPPTSLPNYNTSKNVESKDYYDRESLEFVQSFFAKDFDLFNS